MQKKKFLNSWKLDQDKDSLIAQARGYFALAQLSTFLRNPEKTDLYFRKISNNYKAEELSSTLLGVVGDHLVSKRNYSAAEGFYQYLPSIIVHPNMQILVSPA
jgi:hypothetical protein